MTNSYLALDPGETTGFAFFDDQGIIIEMGQFKQAQQQEWLAANIEPTLKGVVCEDYRNHGHTQQKKWSRNQTSKNIGAIEMICTLRGVPVFLQPNTVKKIGYMWGGLEGPPSNHAISHQYDAYAHGVYWLQRMGIRKPGLAILEGEK